MTTQYDDEYEPDPESEQSSDPRPRDLHAEQATLGAMLLSKRAVDEIVPILGEGRAFYRPANETIYQAIVAVHDTPGVTADPISVGDRLRADGNWLRVGGDIALSKCVSAVPTAANGAYYAEIVVKLGRLRELYEIGARMVQRALMADAEPEEIAAAALTELQATLTTVQAGREEKLSVADRWPGFLDELEQQDDPRALDSPWPELNAHVQFKPKELTVVGAATSGGKSLLALNLAAHVAFRRKLPVLVASIEMGGSELLTRLTSAEANIAMDALTRRKLGDPEWTKISRINDRMVGAEATDFILDDSPSLTIPKIRSRVRWMDSQGRKPALVVVDYLQIVQPDGANAGKNRTQDVAGISLGLKSIADEFHVPVVALAQFNRSSAGRQPLVTDFKDSSQIEQDASCVLLLHRELDEEGQDTGPNAGKVMLIIAKNRNGRRGVETWLQFEGKYASLRNLSTKTPPPWTPSAA